MRPTPYPLEAARTLRAHAQGAAELSLAEARARLGEAQARLESLRRDAAALAGRRVQAGRSAAKSGAALARSGAYAARLQAQSEAQRDVLQAAAGEVHSLERAVRLAELTLTQAFVEREVLERHHARFTQDARKQRARALEDEPGG